MKAYPHLNSPLRIRNSVFQNRLVVGPGGPIFAQASETYPCETNLAYQAQMARTGVGGMICGGVAAENHTTETDNGNKEQIGHQPAIDIMHPISNQHRFAEIAEMVKAENAIAIGQCMAHPMLTEGYDVSSGVWSEYVEGDGSKPVMGKEIPSEKIWEVINAFADAAALMKTLGFQMVEMHFAYRNMFGARFLTKYTNKRTDEWGGSLENRARFIVEVCKAIKERCGKDFLTGIAITAVEPKEIYGDDGITMEETCEFLKMVNGLADIVSIREHQIDYAQGPSFRSVSLPNRPEYHTISQFIRDNNLDIKLAYVCGAHDLDDCEDLIASGDADLILTTRGFISNPDLATKMHEGRGDDVVPCLRCNRCHHDRDDVWHSVCVVNPVFALNVRQPFMTNKVDKPKNIAVIGGGCAGMKFAMDAYDQGHTVTIYEKEDKLGGQLNPASVPYVKTFMKKFRNYLVHQIEKRDITVHLNYEVKPGALKGQYDRIICAIGGVPAVPNIPGKELAITFLDALMTPETVKGDVVVIGGGEVGLETSLEAVHNGHKTLCIERLAKLAPEMAPVHFRRPYREMWEALEDFSWSLESTVSKIEKVGDRLAVSYIKDGKEETAMCDTAIIAAGVKGLYNEAVEICTASDCDYRIIGDCRQTGSVATAMRNAYYTARNM